MIMQRMGRGQTYKAWLMVALSISVSAQAERPYFNDKKYPDSQQDLMAIQKALTSSLEKARKATVCIKLTQGSGSGVIVSPDGLVLTAAHVTGGVDKDLTVVMEDGKEYKAKSLGLHSETDAAMLQIIDGGGNLPHVELDAGKTQNEASSRLGDWVFALGHSGGFDKARGSVVRLGRLVKVADNTIQSDCKLIGGDSGGPLFDINGKLIAIHSRVGAHLEQNMHVPAHVYQTYWKEMKGKDFIGEGPYASRPVKGGGFMGLGVNEKPLGLQVTKVAKNSPASEADIKVGDTIISMNGKEMKSRDDISALLKELVVGDKVSLVILRDGAELQTNLTLVGR